MLILNLVTVSRKMKAGDSYSLNDVTSAWTRYQTEVRMLRMKFHKRKLVGAHVYLPQKFS